MSSDEFTFFVWQLADYTKQFEAEESCRIKSPVFGLTQNKRLKFTLHFYSKCPVDGYENFTALGLGIERFAGQRSVKLHFSIWIEAADEVLKRGSTYVFDSACSHRARVLRSFCQRRSLDPKGKFVQSNTLTIFCQIRRETNEIVIEKPMFNFKQVFDSGAFADFQIKVSEQVFKTHKLVLAANSDVFQAMLNNKTTKEAQTNCLEVEDTNPDIFYTMLKYFYTGKLEQETTESLVILFVLADKYRVLNLMDACVEQLLDNLDVESATSCLALAFQHDNEDLKQEAIEFTIENYKKVLQSESWKLLRSENPELSSQIFDTILDESHVECSKTE
ncbi:Protein roadkill [Aphelenchoides bicaudatus]|nr:Protein roadkill [Aphelenchoides bicaudatus]